MILSLVGLLDRALVIRPRFDCYYSYPPVSMTSCGFYFLRSVGRTGTFFGIYGHTPLTYVIDTLQMRYLVRQAGNWKRSLEGVVKYLCLAMGDIRHRGES